MPRAFIAVGSNLGDRAAYLEKAAELLSVKNKIVKRSRVYETEPVGGPEQGLYLNAVWEIQTALEPDALLNELLAIEKKLGRERKAPDMPRTIDLDILFYGDRVAEKSGLAIPHPRLHERAFVLEPLMDIDPDLRHPKLGKTVRELWESVRETNKRS